MVQQAFDPYYFKKPTDMEGEAEEISQTYFEAPFPRAIEYPEIPVQRRITTGTSAMPFGSMGLPVSGMGLTPQEQSQAGLATTSGWFPEENLGQGFATVSLPSKFGVMGGTGEMAGAGTTSMFPSLGNLGKIGVSLLPSLISNLLPQDNPVLPRMVSTLGTTVGQGLGLLPLPSIGSAALGGLSSFMAGQNDFTNPLSNILSSIPLLGTVLGGFAEGIFGEKPGPVDIDKDWGTKLQSSFLTAPRNKEILGELQKKFGFTGLPAGAPGVTGWASDIYGFPLPFDIYPEGGYGIKYITRQNPELGNVLSGLKSAFLENPAADLTPEQQNWYYSVYVPAMARAYGPYGFLTSGNLNNISSSQSEGTPQFWRQAFEPGSPLSEWARIQRGRDVRMFPQLSGWESKPTFTGMPDELLKFYSEGYGVDQPPIIRQGGLFGGNANLAGSLNAPYGGNPFTGLTEEELKFFFSTVLPEINKFAQSTWIGTENFPTSLTFPGQPTEGNYYPGTSFPMPLAGVYGG